MTNLFPQSLQLILPLLSLALPCQLPCLPLLLSLLQHICPKLHPRRSAKGVNIRTQNSPSPPLPLPQPPPALPITPDTGGPPAMEGFMELAKRSPSPIICFFFFFFLSLSSFTPPHHHESTPLSGIDAGCCRGSAEKTCRQSTQHNMF